MSVYSFRTKSESYHFAFIFRLCFEGSPLCEHHFQAIYGNYVDELKQPQREALLMKTFKTKTKTKTKTTRID